jgi:hypothetical protein
MPRNVEASESGGTLSRGPSACAAICSEECTTPPPAPSRLKACLVDILRHLFELSPDDAIALSYAIQKRGPGFREA